MKPTIGLTLTIISAAVISLFAVQHTAQVSAQGAVTIACDTTFDLSETTIPDEFPGAYYTYTAYPPETQHEIERITQSGRTTLIPPFTVDQVNALRYPTVSPDGRLMAFRSFRETVPFTVWNIETGEIASLQLTPDETDYLITDDMTYYRYHNKLTWRDNTTLVIRYFDEDYLRPIRETEILVSQNPLLLARGTTEDILYPELPVPPENRVREVHLSPLGNYAAQFTFQEVRGTEGRWRLQVFDLDTLQVVFDVPPTSSDYIGSDLIWLPDESHFFYSLVTNGNGNQPDVVHVDVNDNFAVNMSLQENLEANFGGEVYAFVDDAILTHDQQGIVFRIAAPESPNALQHVIVYRPQTGSIIGICDEYIGISGTQILNFMSPEDRYFGFWDSGQVIIFDTQEDETYKLPSIGNNFIGWVDGPDEPPDATATPPIP